MKKSSKIMSIFAKLFNVIARRRKLDSAPPLISGQAICMTTANGFRVETHLGMGLTADEDLVHTFKIYGPKESIQWCSVLLPATVAEEIDVYSGADRTCERSRFLLAVCEEALRSYLERHDRVPSDGCLLVDRLSDTLAAWIDAVLRRRPASL